MTKLIKGNVTIKSSLYKKRQKRQEPLKGMIRHLPQYKFKKRYRNSIEKRCEMTQTLKEHYELFHSIQDL